MLDIHHHWNKKTKNFPQLCIYRTTTMHSLTIVSALYMEESQRDTRSLALTQNRYDKKQVVFSFSHKVPLFCWSIFKKSNERPKQNHILYVQNRYIN